MASKKKQLSTDSKSPLKNRANRCIFCNGAAGNEEKFGKFITKNEISVHYFCLLFSSALVQRGTDKQGILGFLLPDIRKEINRGRRLRCFYCKRVGATVGCVVSSCRRAFHFGCGVDNGGLNQFCQNFSSFCFEHRPRQSAPSSDRLAFHGTAKATCSICMCSVEARASDHTLRAPCCKNSWFHRSCVQKHATCAGVHFFKCPLCNNTDIFQEEMLTYGIYLPDQDAAWELEPNAFEELLERHTHCDMPLCVCEKGRDYHQEKGKWHVVLCHCCGAKGCHVACGSLKGIKSVWDCDDCRVPTTAKKSPPKAKTQKSPPKPNDQKKKKETKKRSTEEEEEVFLIKKIEMLGKLKHQRSHNTKKRKMRLNEEAENQLSKKRKKSSKHKKSLEGTAEATASDAATLSSHVSSDSSKKRSHKASPQKQKGDKHSKRNSKSTSRQDWPSMSDYNPADCNKKKSPRRSLLGGRWRHNTPVKHKIAPKSKEVRCLLQADVHTRANLGPKLATQFSSNCKISKTPSSPLSASGDSVNVLGSSEGDFPRLNLSLSPGYSSIGVPSSVGSPCKRLVMSCTDNEEILMISDDENEPTEKRENASDKSFLGHYSNQAKKEAGNSSTPVWARKLLNDDILTGANLGSKFASQFNSINSSRHERRLSRKTSQFYLELDQQVAT